MWPGIEWLLLNRRKELRAFWRLLLFVPLFLLATMIFRGLLVPFAGIGGLLGATISAAGVLLGALVSGMMVLVALDRRRPGALGFALTAQIPRELGLGILIGGGVLALMVGILSLAGKVTWSPDTGTALGYVGELGRDLVLWGVAAAAEEALFRGYAFQVLVEGIGPVAATVLASGAFALAHISNPDVGVFALCNIFLAGVLLSVAYLRTRSLWFATAVHLAWNWTMGTILALPVSGLVLIDTPLYDAHAGAPVWLTGGAFGPEGGLVATVAFGLALVAVLRAPVGESARMMALRPLVDSRLRPQAETPATA